MRSQKNWWLWVGGSILRRGPPELRPWKIGLIAVFAAWLVIANTTPMSLAMPTLLLWTWAGVARGRQTAPSPARWSFTPRAAQLRTG